MALSSSVVLAILNIVFYAPVLPICLFVAFRHGFTKNAGWVYLLLLALMRLVGEPMVVATNGVPEPGNTVSTVGQVLGGVGLTPLILAPVGLLGSVNAAVHTVSGRAPPLPQPLFHAMHLPAVVAVALFIAGSTNSDPAPDKVRTAQTDRVAAAAVFLVCWLLLALFAAVVFAQRRRLAPAAVDQAPGARLLLFAVLAVLPFLAARIIDTCLMAFPAVDAQAANAANVALRAVLVTVMEWIIVLICVTAGLRARALPQPVPAYVQAAHDAGRRYDAGGVGPGSAGSYEMHRVSDVSPTDRHPLQSGAGAVAADDGHDQRAYNHTPEQIQRRQDQRQWQTQYNGLNDLYTLADKLGDRLEKRIEKKIGRGRR